MKKLPLLLPVLYFSLFLNLDYFPFQIWDEAREAIHAYEMNQNGNFLVSHYEANPDMWSLKPPLLTWLQVIFIKLIGFNELAIRLPSALAALGTCLMLFFFVNKITTKTHYGFIAAVILVSFNSFVNIHSSRTGDIDSLLTFYLTWSLIEYYHVLYYSRKSLHLLLMFLAFTCAVLSKGIAGLFFTPAMVLLYAHKVLIIKPPHSQQIQSSSQSELNFLQKVRYFLQFNVIRLTSPIRAVWRNKSLKKSLIIGVGLFLFSSLGFYMGRELLNPGYVEAVAQNEWLSRYLTTLEFHQQPFNFYFKFIWEHNHPVLLILGILGVFIGFSFKESAMRNLVVFATLVTFSHLLLISFSATKLWWYSLPVFPWMAILATYPLGLIYDGLKDLNILQRYLRHNIVPGMLILVILSFFYLPEYHRIASRVETAPYLNKDFYSMSYYLRNGIQGKTQSIEGLKVLNDGYYAHLLSYRNMALERGIHFTFSKVEYISVGDEVLVNRDSLIHELSQRFEISVNDSLYSTRRISVLASKP